MVSESVQDHCDWCFGALTDPARARSRWLGLATEGAWACADCLEAGRYRVQPEGWAGPEEEWLARDEYVLCADDLTVIVNALNEALLGPNAVEGWEFQTRLGVTRAEALQTMRRIGGRGVTEGAAGSATDLDQRAAAGGAARIEALEEQAADLEA